MTATETVATLRASFRGGLTRPISWRLEQLTGLEAMLREQTREIERALGADLGRAPTEAFLTEVYAVMREVRSLRRGLRRWSRDEHVMTPVVLRPARTRVVREPLGVALIVGPWNYPINLVLSPLAAALAAGNCVVAKPSELAPASSALLASLLPEYLDRRAVALVEGGASEVEALIDAPVDHVFFTGGAATGRLVAERAGRHLTPLTLELGGKSPALVDESADLEVAARRIVWGKMLNAGQSCVAPDYVLVTDGAAREFSAAALHSLRQFYGEDPHASRDFGRIINARHTERLAKLLQNHGGDVLVGGEIDFDERYVAPTIVLDPAPEAALMHEEIFGPILPVLTVADLDEAAAFVAERPAPLALYVFSEDGAAVARVQAATRSGSVCVNTTVHQFASSRLPFGGVGPSGYGRYHGRFGYETFTQLRPVLEKPPHPDISLTYPPYRAARARFLRSVLLPPRPFSRRR